MNKLDYATVEPATKKFLESLQGPPLYTLTPNEARMVLSGLQSQDVQKLPTEIDDHTIPWSEWYY
jgi:acetyl esterase